MEKLLIRVHNTCVWGSTVLFSFYHTLGTTRVRQAECVQSGEGFSLTSVGLMLLFYQYKINPTKQQQKYHCEDVHRESICSLP